MGFIDKDQETVTVGALEVVQKGIRGLAGFPSIKIAGVVFDPVDITNLPNHL